MITDPEITALAREYAEETVKGTAVENLPDGFKENVIQRNADHFEKHLRWLLRRYCLVKRSKATALCRLALEHGESVDYGLIDGLTDMVCELFPEQYEQEARNTEIAKEVEG